MAGLRHCPGSRESLSGQTDSTLLDSLVGAKGEVVTSTDLTSSTDLFPRDLLEAIADGLADSGKLSPQEAAILKLQVGPQWLHYPGEKEPVLSEEGVLMGQPVAWCFLSIIHLWWL